jgi:hypothetical protein
MRYLWLALLLGLLINSFAENNSLEKLEIFTKNDFPDSTELVGEVIFLDSNLVSGFPMYSVFRDSIL